MKKCIICNSLLITPSKKLTSFVLSCPTCYLHSFLNAKTIEYEDHYFLEEYQKQYKSTYINDKKKIQHRMQWRLQLLNQYLSKAKIPNAKNKSLLEIGSSAGFFLELAQKSNYHIQGWEISNFMTKYANKAGIPTIQGDLFSLYQKYKNQKKFDVIAAFYVIEHLSDQQKIWEIFSDLIKPNGFLLISTPSIFGPTFYFNLPQWIQTHPKDHFVDYSPKSIKKIAKLFQFKVVTQKAEGIHPQRFWKGSSIIGKYLYTLIQRKFTFSDTLFTILQKNAK